MADFFDLLGAASAPTDAPLEELRINDEPAPILLFTRDSEPAQLHFEKDEAVHAYVPCPGDGCPLCRLGSRPRLFILLPVFDLTSGAVKVLRVSTRKGATTLGDQLTPHLKSVDTTDSVLALTRTNARYSVRRSKLSPAADRGGAAITGFLERRKDGLKLASVFATYSSEELAQVPRVQKLLTALGLSDGDGGAGDPASSDDEPE